jgi:hypothetical protein
LNIRNFGYYNEECLNNDFVCDNQPRMTKITTPATATTVHSVARSVMASFFSRNVRGRAYSGVTDDSVRAIPRLIWKRAYLL